MLEVLAKDNNALFLTCLEEKQKAESRGNEGAEFWAKVINKEVERDKLFLEELNTGKNIFVEQWHIGNWSRAQSLGIDLPQEIQNKLNQQIGSLTTRIRAFYVSTDLEKYYFDSELEAKRRELNELPKILRNIGITTENLNGDAGQDNLKKRLHYLLEQA